VLNPLCFRAVDILIIEWPDGQSIRRRCGHVSAMLKRRKQFPYANLNRNVVELWSVPLASEP
jgi:hypothetical protein